MAKRIVKRKEKNGGRSVNRQPDPQTMKRQQAFVDSVICLADPLCVAEGTELVHVEYQREPGGLTLRLYIDKPGGVTLDDCIDISRQLDDILEVHIQDLPPYRLEVSSPGLDRPVSRRKDFIRFMGQQVKIRLTYDVNGRKNFTGVLDGVVDDMVRVQMDRETISLNMGDISRARLTNYNGEG